MSTRDQNSPAFTRRDLLKASSCGFGMLALNGLCSELFAKESASPLISRPGPSAGRARRVIFLFMQGGPSHVDTFDYKPQLNKDAGKKVSAGGRQGGPLLATPFKFRKHGDSGLPISNLYPELSKHADDLCLINGMHTDSPAHPQATVMVHTGSINFVRPSVGAWTLYGLGTDNQDLPGFVTINPTPRLGGAQNYGSAFLPACFQGTRIDARGGGVSNLATRGRTPKEQRRQLDLLQDLHKDLQRRTRHADVDALIESFELAFRMQSSVPEVLDIQDENEETRALYGIDEKPSANFGRQCLMARRLAEAGVRYIEVGHGGWDQHNNLTKKLSSNALATDKPIAGLIADLKRRGLFDDTLIVWGGEFGRTPSAQNGDGRRHNNRGYTMWMAGGPVQGGMRYGATDEHGFESVENKVHIHDLHATMLHTLGLDHEKLTYKYAGRDFRLTDVYGRVVHEILS